MLSHLNSAYREAKHLEILKKVMFIPVEQEVPGGGVGEDQVMQTWLNNGHLARIILDYVKKYQVMKKGWQLIPTPLAPLPTLLLLELRPSLPLPLLFLKPPLAGRPVPPLSPPAGWPPQQLRAPLLPRCLRAPYPLRWAPSFQGGWAARLWGRGLEEAVEPMGRGGGGGGRGGGGGSGGSGGGGWVGPRRAAAAEVEAEGGSGSGEGGGGGGGGGGGKMAAPVLLRVSVPRWERVARYAVCAAGILLSIYAYHVEREKERDPEHRALCDLGPWVKCSAALASRYPDWGERARNGRWGEG